MILALLKVRKICLNGAHAFSGSIGITTYENAFVCTQNKKYVFFSLNVYRA